MVAGAGPGAAADLAEPGPRAPPAACRSAPSARPTSMALAVSVALSAVIIGAVLSTALLIGPAATALRVAKSPVRAMAARRASASPPPGSASCSPTTATTGRPHGHGWPVSFFVVDAGRRRLPAHLPAPAQTPAEAAPRKRTRSRHVHRPDAEHLDRGDIVAVIAGVTGFFAVLRGQTFAAHAIPNGAFAGAAGASLLGLNALVGAGGLLGGGRARHRRARPPGPAATWPPRWRWCSCSGSARCSSAGAPSTRRRPTRCCSARCSASARARCCRSSCSAWCRSPRSSSCSAR